ncbi:MAG: hypothetical protein GYB67_10625 [Chloroflexi bacterium]|nr:hypothetical protein [Chloroflexota bacterium]
MLKKLTLCLLLILALSAVIPVGATPLDELTTLAAQVPADTQVFAAFRIDSDYFDTLESISASIEATIGAELPRDLQIENISNPIEEELGSWIGTTAAAIITDTAPAVAGRDVPAIIAFAVTDRTAAEAFLDDILDGDDFTKTETEAYTLYAGGSFDIHYLVRDDAMLITLMPDMPAETLLFDFDTSLAESEAFIEAQASLPEDEYNIFVYADLPAILGPVAPLAGLALSGTPLAGADIAAIPDALGPLTIGLTIFDDRTLVVDVVEPVIDSEALGLSDARPRLALDFLSLVPADAALVIHDRGIGKGFVSLLDGIDALGEQLDAAGIALPELTGAEVDDPVGELILNEINIDDLAAFTRLTFRGLTGLTIEDGLGWMTDDYINYLSVRTDDGALSFENSLLVAVTDVEAANALFAALQDTADQVSVEATLEGDILALETGSTIRSVLPRTDLVISDLLIGQTDEVFAVGTRAGVEFALNPTDDSLVTDPTFMTASEYFLPDTVTLLYASVAAPAEALQGALRQMDRGVADAIGLLGVIESASITATSAEERPGVLRLAMTIAGE